jgi:drug/metabolite transporter (DMT)-like permease
LSKPATPVPARPQNNGNSSRLGVTDLFMLLTIVIWGFNFSVIKIALREFTPGSFNGPRLAVASLLLLVFLRLKEGTIAPPRGDLFKLIVLGIVGNTFYQFLFISGIRRTTASSTSLILTMTPILIAVLSAIFLKERIHWIGWVGILTSFFGLYFVVFENGAGISIGKEGLKGNLMILVGNIFWAVYTVFSKPLLERMSALRLTTWTLSFGALFYLPLTAKEIVALHWRGLSARSLGALFFSAVFAIAISYVTWYSSVKRVGNTKTGIFSNITPVFTVIFAQLLLGERIGLTKVIGALVIILGFYLTRFGHRWFKKPGQST